MSYRFRLTLILISVAAISALFMGVLCFRIMRKELEIAAIGWSQDIAVSTAHFLTRSGLTIEKLESDPELFKKLNAAKETMDLEMDETPSIWESTVIAVPEGDKWRIIARQDPPDTDYAPVGSIISVEPMDAHTPRISVDKRTAGWFQTPRARFFGAAEPLDDHKGVILIGAREEMVTGIFLEIFETTAIAFAVVAFLGVLVSWPLSKRMVRPIQAIRSFATALDQGHFEKRLEPAGPAEIKALFADLNRFARNLADREQLVQRNRQLRGTVESQESRANALSALEVDFSQLTDFDLLMGRVLETVPRVTHSRFCGIFLAEGGELTLGYAVHAGKSRKARQAVIGHSTRSVGILAEAIEQASARVERIDASSGAWVDAAGLDGVPAAAIAMKSGSGETLGVVVVARESGSSPQPFTDQELADLRHVASLVSMALERRAANETILWRMVKMAETRDPSETGSHVKRVSATALEIFDGWAKRRGMRDEDVQFARSTLRMAAILHDVGKVGISDLVLKKPGKLTDEEYGTMKHHTLLGAALLPGHGPHDEAAREVAMHHHERWDGKGYPGPVSTENLGNDIPALSKQELPRTGIAGDDIPLFARIVAIADVFDALSSRRAYKEPWTADKVEEEMRSQGGKAFDLELLEIFFERLERIRAARSKYPEQSEAKA
ncbi:MAG: HD domain-containing protein [Planctomycetes bacterium]|nr:HD domain-containing protein [Planctomycetota bacterium]